MQCFCKTPANFEHIPTGNHGNFTGTMPDGKVVKAPICDLYLEEMIKGKLFG